MLSSVVPQFGEATPRVIRNVCLVAHVDHGKTTFADCLLAANNVISRRLAGKLRFMDTRDDEQRRGITMKASVTSVLFPPMVVNIVDSPGHVEFTAEVADALLLADTVLLLVDAVEGVRSQTESLLRLAVSNGQTVILVINKIDRLRVELKMSEGDAHTRIREIIEHTNGCLSQILRGFLSDDAWNDMDEVERRMHFEPSKLNVLFASATRSFAFSLLDFAEMWAPKLDCTSEELIRTLFDDFYVSQKKIMPNAYNKGKKNMFEQMVIAPLWQIFDAAHNQDLPFLNQIAGKLNIILKSRRVEDALDELLREWLPLPRATFRLVARSPDAKLCLVGRRIGCLVDDEHPLNPIIKACDKDGPTLVFVAKLFQMDGRRLSLVRVFSGTVRVGDILHCVSAPSVCVSGLFLVRGRDLVVLPVVVAGFVCAMETDPGVPALATLCSEPIEKGICINRDVSKPIMKVALRTKLVEEGPLLRDALRQMSLYDNSVRVVEQEDGELALMSAGEVHLQKCLTDLEEYGMVDLDVSDPIVSFLETTIPDPSLSHQQLADHVTELQKIEMFLRLRVVPLSIEVTELLDSLNGDPPKGFKEKLIDTAISTLPIMKGSFWYKMSEDAIRSLFEKIWSFGSDRAKANLLFNNIPDYGRNVWDDSSIRDMDNSIVSGFELFVDSGPLCGEPMRGVAVIVEEWISRAETSAMSGTLMTTMCSTCTAAARKTPLRLLAAMYKCVVHTPSSALGKVYAVLAQRKAKVTKEDVDEVTGLFTVDAWMPVVESFSFCDQLRKKTSGMASGLLSWSHWQLIEEDPFWQPTTEEEIEDYGVIGDSPNCAHAYMNAVRKRKGLPTDEILVLSAEKQRNLKKNK